MYSEDTPLIRDPATGFFSTHHGYQLKPLSEYRVLLKSCDDQLLVNTNSSRLLDQKKSILESLSNDITLLIKDALLVNSPHAAMNICKLGHALGVMGIFSLSSKCYRTCFDVIKSDKIAASQMLWSIKQHNDVIINTSLPHDVQTVLHWGDIMLASKCYILAYAMFDAIIKVAPDHEVANHRRQLTMSPLIKSDGIMRLRVHSHREIGAIESLRNVARLQLEVNLPDFAQMNATACLQINPRDAEALSIRAGSFVATEHYTYALHDVQSSLQLRPGDIRTETLWKKVRQLIEQSNATLVETIRPNVTGDHSVSDCGQTIFNATQSIIPNEENVPINLKNLSLYNTRARKLYLHRHYEKALEILEQSVELKRDDANMLKLRGSTLFNLNRYQEAVASYQLCLNINPADEEAAIFCEVAKDLLDLDDVCHHEAPGIAYPRG